MKETVYRAKHEALGAKMEEFAGFYMPIQYDSITNEHLQVRNKVGVFDVSHMGEFTVKGPKALALLQHITTNDVCNIVTNETDGTFGEWTSSDEDGYPAYYLVWTGSDEDNPKGFWFFDNSPFERNLGGNYYSTELTMEVDEEQIVKFTRVYTPGRNALGLARMSDIAPTITDTVTKLYVEGLGIEAGISAENATNIAESVVNATVTNVVRSVAHKVANYMWDGDVCWRREPRLGGYIEFVAVTNIDVTLPENYEALEALERRDNQ